MDNIFEKKYTITVIDVDNSNTITNYGFLRLMQEAASAHSDMLGVSANHFKETPYAWLILNWRLNVITRPNWNTNVIIKTWPSNFDKIYAFRDFEMRTEDGTIIAKATSKWVLVNAYTHSIERAPEAVLTAFKPYRVNLFNEPLNKLKEPNTFEFTSNYTIQRSDLDSNNHANNLIYLRLALNMLPDDIYNNNNFKNVEIFYKMQCKFGDEIVCMYSFENNEHIVTIKSKDMSTLHCIVKMK